MNWIKFYYYCECANEINDSLIQVFDFIDNNIMLEIKDIINKIKNKTKTFNIKLVKLIKTINIIIKY